MTDFQKFNTAQLASDEIFYRLLATILMRQLKFAYDFEGAWNAILGGNMCMEDFLRDLLNSAGEHLVWFMDEVDKVFAAPFATDFFALVRSWHNSRSTERPVPGASLRSSLVMRPKPISSFETSINPRSTSGANSIWRTSTFSRPRTRMDVWRALEKPRRSRSPLRRDWRQPFLTRAALDALGVWGANRRLPSSHTPTRMTDRSATTSSACLSPFPFCRMSPIMRGLCLPVPPCRIRTPITACFPPELSSIPGGGKVDFRCELYCRYLSRLLPA